MKKSQAFTLIELLVVVSIIAILAGISLPVFTGAIERGRVTADRNNLSQIGKGIIMYLNDNDGAMFPLAPTNAAETWPAVLQARYVKDWKTFRSPFDKVTTARPNNISVPPIPVSYQLISTVFDTIESKWQAPASLVMMSVAAIDYGTSTTSVMNFKTDAFSNSNVRLTRGLPPGWLSTSKMGGTHSSRLNLNVLFADGHVEDMTWTAFWAFADSASKQRWNPMSDGS